jgi:hypothetical protein
MRPILSSKELAIPEVVEVTVKSRRITVKGPRGTLAKDLSHVAADLYIIEDKDEGTKKLKVDIHFSTRKGLSCLRTVVSHVSNMIIGVTRGFRCAPSLPSAGAQVSRSPRARSIQQSPYRCAAAIHPNARTLPLAARVRHFGPWHPPFTRTV